MWCIEFLWGCWAGEPLVGVSGNPKGYAPLPFWTLTNLVSNPAILSGHLFIALPINAYLLKCVLDHFYHLPVSSLTNDLNETRDTITFFNPLGPRCVAL